MTVLPPPGWYAAPGEVGSLRWWDGTRWTEHRAPAGPPASAAGTWDERAGLARAGLGPRIAAFFIDGLVLNIVLLPASVIWTVWFFLSLDFDPVTGPSSANWSRTFVLSYLVLMALSLATPVVYGALFEGTAHGQTIGKWAMGIGVRGRDGEPIGRRRAFKRHLMRLVSMFVFYLGILAVFWDDERRTWHDRVAETHVYVLPEKPGFGELLRAGFGRS